MPKRPTKRTRKGSDVVKSELPDGLLNAEPVAYPVADITITALQIYHNPERKPDGEGPWRHEADKIAWIDADTGLGCIMLRQENGTISGYVSVPPHHPLFGYQADAVPVAISNTVHGGVTYGKACEVNRFARKAWGEPRKERYTVCHVTHVRMVQDYRTVQTTEDEFHEDLWWFGFDTSHPGDLVPKGRKERRKGDVYRDQTFVYANCTTLARKLKSVLDAEESSSATKAPQTPLLLPPSTDGDH
ncbi:MAG: hypothetical protein V2I43_09885 [Parvularcula sp.]|jgi:hypothetical protein|nr:hypothetical protein [Parvularcula sp.]